MTSRGFHRDEQASTPTYKPLRAVAILRRSFLWSAAVATNPEKRVRAAVETAATHAAAIDADAAKAASKPVAMGGAGLVASGILLSRIAGVIRESVFAHYLGNSGAADAFKITRPDDLARAEALLAAQTGPLA